VTVILLEKVGKNISDDSVANKYLKNAVDAVMKTVAGIGEEDFEDSGDSRNNRQLASLE